jgi:phage terminase large subunit
VPCTAPSAHQLRDILWSELTKWRRHADQQSQQRGDHPHLWLSHLFTLTTDRLYDATAKDWEAVARTARKENPDAIQGFHAEHLLYVLDEASGIPEEIYEAAEGALSTPGARVLMLGNPTRTSGTFYDSHHKSRGDYTPLHFRSQDSPLVAPEYRPRLVRKWGEGSNVVRVRADGEFPKQEADVLIPLELAEACTMRDARPVSGLRQLGVDVAWTGEDRTTLVLRQGPMVDHIQVYAKQDPMVTVGRILEVVDPWQVDEVFIDTIGLGAGVYARLLEVRRGMRPVPSWQVYSVNAGALVAHPQRAHQATRAQPSTLSRYVDARPKRLRDYLWLEVARWLREAEPFFAEPDREVCEDLAGELATVKYAPDSEGHLVVEAKDDMKKRLGHSPDIADGLNCTFAPTTAPRQRALGDNEESMFGGAPWGSSQGAHRLSWMA